MACQTGTTAVTELQKGQNRNDAESMESRKPVGDGDTFLTHNKRTNHQMEWRTEEKSEGLTVGQSCCDDAGCLAADSKFVRGAQYNGTTQVTSGDLPYKRSSLAGLLSTRWTATSVVFVLIVIVITKIVSDVWTEKRVETWTMAYAMFPLLLMLVFAGTLVIYSVKKLSRRETVLDQENKVCVQLAKTSSRSFTETWCSVFNIPGVVFAVIIVPLFALFSLLYTIFKFVSQAQGVVANVTPKFGSRWSFKGISFKGRKLSAVKANIEEVIYLMCLPITIPVMVIKKLFTKQTLAAFVPFLTILTFLYRLLKLKRR